MSNRGGPFPDLLVAHFLLAVECRDFQMSKESRQELDYVVTAELSFRFPVLGLQRLSASPLCRALSLPREARRQSSIRLERIGPRQRISQESINSRKMVNLQNTHQIAVSRLRSSSSLYSGAEQAIPVYFRLWTRPVA